MLYQTSYTSRSRDHADSRLGIVTRKKKISTSSLKSSIQLIVPLAWRGKRLHIIKRVRCNSNGRSFLHLVRGSRIWKFAEPHEHDYYYLENLVRNPAKNESLKYSISIYS